MPKKPERIPDDELATWCRILAVGPPCPHPCGGCRRRPVRLADLDQPDDRMITELP